MVEAAIRELPGVEDIESARDSLQVRAKLKRTDPYGGQRRVQSEPLAGSRVRNQVQVTVTPDDDPAA